MHVSGTSTGSVASASSTCMPALSRAGACCRIRDTLEASPRQTGRAQPRRVGTRQRTFEVPVKVHNVLTQDPNARRALNPPEAQPLVPRHHDTDPAGHCTLGRQARRTSRSRRVYLRNPPRARKQRGRPRSQWRSAVNLARHESGPCCTLAHALSSPCLPAPVSCVRRAFVRERTNSCQLHHAHARLSVVANPFPYRLCRCLYTYTATMRCAYARQCQTPPPQRCPTGYRTDTTLHTGGCSPQSA